LKLRLRFFWVAILLLVPCSALAEAGEAAWLRYTPITGANAPEQFSSLPTDVVSLDHSVVAMSAQTELARGVDSMLGKKLRTEASRLPDENAFVLGTFTELQPRFL